MIKSFAIFSNRQFQNIAISHFAVVFGTTLPMPVLSVFLQNQGFSESQIGLIMGVTALSALLVRPWVGFRADTKGSRSVILTGQLLFFISTIGYLPASLFIHFFLLRMLFGIGSAAYGTGAVTFASCIGTGEANTNAIAMYTLVTMLGLGLSMSMAQIIFDLFGFYVLVITSLCCVIFAFGIMKLRAAEISSCSSNTRSSFLQVLKTPAVLATMYSQFAASFAFSALFTFIPLASLAENISFYSLFFIAFAVFVICSRFFVRRINDLLGLEKTVYASSIAMLISILLFFTGISPTSLLLGGILFGTGFGVIFPTLVLLLVRRIKENNRGTGLSVLTAASDIGNALSAASLGLIAEHYGYPSLFLVLIIILLCGNYGFFTALRKTGTPVKQND